MSDVTFGFLLIGVAMIVVLGIVFAITLRTGPPRERATPPRGVHLPPPSFLPVIMSIAALLMGAGFAFRSPDQLANPWLALPGLAVFVFGIVSWIAAANREWRETEHASHDDGAAH